MFIKSTFYFYFIFFSQKYIMGEELHHFMKKKYFASDEGIITGIKIKLCKKSCRKENVGGA